MLTVHALGHSTVVLDVDGSDGRRLRLLTDPLLGANAGVLRRRGPAPDPACWAGTDVVLLSHLHHDHAEVSSLRRLPGVPILTSAANAQWVRRRGLHGVGLDDRDGTGLLTVGPGGWMSLGHGVEVCLTRADHHARPMPVRPNDANGHLLRCPDARVWIAGDTSLYPELIDLPELAGGPIDLAVVPVGGWGPRLSPGHLDPEGAAAACATVGARNAVAVHSGALFPPGVPPGDWMQRPRRDFAVALARQAPGCRLHDASTPVSL